MAPVTGFKRKRPEAEPGEFFTLHLPEQYDQPPPAHVDRPTVKHLALREIELEIAMKERIAETVEARIAWALFLQQSLQSESTGPSCSFLRAPPIIPNLLCSE